MHSRIFQVSLSPINKSNYIIESDYWDHWFLNEIADYVAESNDRNEDIEWLKNCYKEKGIEFGADNNGEYFIVKSKQAYFKQQFNKFMETIDKIKNYTLDNFAQGFHEMWLLKNAYEEKFGAFYVDIGIDEDEDLMSFDSFVRMCTIEKKYYIGGTMDYHC